MINYFTATTDSPIQKSFFCGRESEITDIINWISAGKNVAVIGETRIGKTFLRYILRDLCTGSITEYIAKMHDVSLARNLKDLLKIIPKIKTIDLSLHTIRDGDTFYSSFADELLDGPVASEKITVRSLKKILCKQVIPKMHLENSKLVLFLDELDVVREYDNLMEVLGFLKEVSEEQSLFSFVLFGWPGVLDRIRARYSGVESTIIDSIDKKLYLNPLNIAKTNLIVDPLTSLYSHIDNNKLAECIYELTGGRPYFIQYICDLLIYNEEIKKAVDKSLDIFVEEIVAHFYRNHSIREVLKSIWHAGFEKESEITAYIAHHPGTKVNKLIAFYEKYQHIEIRDFVDRLTKYGKISIRDQNDTYVNGLLLEKWAQTRKENPVKTYCRQKIEDSYKEKHSFGFAEWSPPQNENDFDKIITKLIEEFRHNIEQKKGAKLLWLENQPAPEENAQILFDVMSDQYAQLADIDINREIETGRGPVDFKFSKGYSFQAHLEVKRATSSKLVHGLRKQLPTYLKADKVRNGYYLVICYDENDLLKSESLIAEAAIIAKELTLNLQVSQIKAFQKIESASKIM